jgi:Dolichyl-phosphate-mannose-protein mannosyltransferase
MMAASYASIGKATDEAVLKRRMPMASEEHEELRNALPWLTKVLVSLSVLFFGLCFVHLRADFPNHSIWNDWSKMTDEGWYSGGAIQHFVQGSWYLPQSFNPAVAMPVWPAILWVGFRLTGVNVVTARAMMLLVYGASLFLLFSAVRRERGSLAAAATVALITVNPFCYAFNRMAILEPLLVFWMILGIWLAGKIARESTGQHVGLGVVLCLMVLTKTTGLFLAPAVLYQLWASWGWPKRGWSGMATVVGSAIVLWLGYYLIVVKPHFLEDYRLLFLINQNRVHLSIIPRAAYDTLRDGLWINRILFSLALATVVLSVVWLRELWRSPLYGSLILAALCYLGFIGYHSNLQPRYYLVLTMPVVVVVVYGLGALWERRRWPIMAASAAALTVAALIMMVQTVLFVAHPEYSMLSASQEIAKRMHSDRSAKQVLLSDSGGDISLITGVPAVCEGYATHGLDPLLDLYQPGWYAAWPGWEDPAIKAVGKRYRLEEMARYTVFDDPTRNVLVLYRLEPLQH